MVAEHGDSTDAIPQERIQRRTVDEIEDVPVPQERSRGGDRDRDSRRNHDDMTKDDAEACVRQCAVKLDTELR